MDTNQADVFLTCCTSAAVVAREVPRMAVLAVPLALEVGADYGVTAEVGDTGAARFVQLMVSAPGQATFARFGFGAPGAFQCRDSYNPGVFHALRSSRHPALLWVRFAAFLSFLAIAAALLTPVAQLADDVRTGRLGGVCSAGKPAVAGNPVGDTAEDHAHCDLCGSLAWVLPPVVAQPIPTQATRLLALDAPPSELARFGLGLLYSRGPPSFLT